MRFINTDRFSPVVYANDMPQEGSIAYKQWWSEQRRRCVFGYEVEDAIEPGGDAIVDGVDAIWYVDDNGNEICYIKDHHIKIVNRKVRISGFQYFYLNFWTIWGLSKGADIKKNVKPRFTDLDFLIFWSIVRMFIEKKDQMFFKARQKGFSEKIACVVAWIFLFVKNSCSVIVAGEDKYNQHTMSNVIRGLDELFDTEFYKRRSPNRTEYVKASYEETIILPDGTKVKRKRGSNSEIYSYSAKNNPQVLSRLSPTIVIYEETGKWQKENLLETISFVEPSLHAEGKKTGFQCFIGTGGDTEESVWDMMEMFDKPDEFNLITYENSYEEGDGARIPYFIPGWWFKILDEDGNSKKEVSIKEILAERNKKEKTKDRATTMMPLTPSEGFMVTGGGYFPPEMVEVFNDRLTFIRNNRSQDPSRKGNLYWNDAGDWSKGCYFKPGPDSNGNEWIMIMEDPHRDSHGDILPIYFPGTDSYDRTEANTSTSKGACYIFKGFEGASSVNKMWVARIVARPTEAQGGNTKFYELTMLLTAYYGAKNLIEYSNVLIFSHYEQNYATELLRERPQFVNASWIMDSKMNNRWGIEPSTKPHWLAMLRKTLREDNFALIHKMWDRDQILEYIRFKYDPSGKKYNSDITIASALSVVNYSDSDEVVPSIASTVNADDPNRWCCHTMDSSGDFSYEQVEETGEYNSIYF